MKNITKSLLGVALITLSLNAYAFGPYGEQTSSGNFYITSNTGWSESEYYKIIDIDAAKLTDAALPKFTASDGAKNAASTDFGSGSFGSPVMTTTDGEIYTPTGLMWPINYYMAAFAPTMYTSAYSKINILGSGVSGTGTTSAFTLNDNSVKQSAIFAKPGFIELSRQASAVAKTPPSLHGYIQIDSLPQVERIQWSYSSTSWKRGVKMDVNYNDGNGWIPQRWLASDYSAWEASFSEQGYQFEEMINKQEDPNSLVSIRFRIWDGDSIHMKVNANDLSDQEVPYSATMTPYDQRQTVRIHQVLVFSNVIPTKVPGTSSAVKNLNENAIKVYRSENSIVLSEMADVELFSYDGKRVFNGHTDKINVSDFSKGLYIVKAVGTSGRTLKKIVI